MQKRFRLRHTSDFQRLRAAGTSYRHPSLILSVLPNSYEHNRYGFITGKRLGNAVVRNRTRRLLREAMRSLHESIQPGYDVVIIARSALVGKPFSYFQRILKEMLERAGLLIKEPSQ